MSSFMNNWNFIKFSTPFENASKKGCILSTMLSMLDTKVKTLLEKEKDNSSQHQPLPILVCTDHTVHEKFSFIRFVMVY